MEKVLYTVTRNIVRPPIVGVNPSKLFYLPQDVLEWAGRICYNTNHKFGTDTAFLEKIIRSEHFDVLEHAYFGAEFTILPEYKIEDWYYFAYAIQKRYPFLRVDIEGLADRKISLYGNFRVWHEMHSDSFTHLWGFIDNRDMHELMLTLNNLAPLVFALPSWLYSQNEPDSIGGLIRDGYVDAISKAKGFATVYTSSGANVALLGKTLPSEHTKRYHATFQFTGVSRALTHQLVRHRLLSFSQESQRYVDPGNFKYVLPEVSSENKSLIDSIMNSIQTAYRTMRDSGARKEDARVLLPNATMTSIVVSGEEKGWRHFCKLRTAKDAQYEIREVANAVQAMLEADNA